MMGHPEELGKVQPGYYADVILVDGNPLEDLEILQDSAKLHAIVINGHIHKNLSVAKEDGQSVTAEGISKKTAMYNNLPLMAGRKAADLQKQAETDGIGVDPRQL